MPLILATLIAVFGVSLGDPPAGLVAVPSTHDVPQTFERLLVELEARGMRVFARMDHADNAASVNHELRPTMLLLFGNPRIGSQLMRCGQTVGIDLPQKFLVWEDVTGSVWIGFNEPEYLAARHGLDGCHELLSRVETALEAIARAAAAPA